MFLDEKMMGPRPEPPPRPTPRRLSPGGERAMLAIIGVNLVLLLVAPIGGATILQGLFTLIFGG